MDLQGLVLRLHLALRGLHVPQLLQGVATVRDELPDKHLQEERRGELAGVRGTHCSPPVWHLPPIVVGCPLNIISSTLTSGPGGDRTTTPWTTTPRTTTLGTTTPGATTPKDHYTHRTTTPRAITPRTTTP